MKTLQEYDLEIKLAKMFMEKVCVDYPWKHKTKDMRYKMNHLIVREIYGWENKSQMYQTKVLQISATTSTWYFELKYYLSQGACP